MKSKPSKPKETDGLRKRAEKNIDPATRPIEKLSDVEVRNLAHELQVHQIELEMQNDELRKSQLALQASRDKYSNLYDFAPVGYLTISDKGIILEVNLTGSLMLGTERSLLIGKPFSRFVMNEYSNVYYREQNRICKAGDHGMCELGMVRNDGTQFYVQLECTVESDAEEVPLQLMTSMTDITDRKRAEGALQKAHDELEDNIAERTSELTVANASLKDKNRELEHYRELFVDREFRIKELRDKIKELENKS